MKSESISVRELARIAGVSAATVSLALRESPKLAPETVARIRQLAKDHGYRRNPKLSRILAETVSSRYGHTGEVIACLVTRQTRAQWDPESEGFLGMSARATDYGYKVEPFFFLEEGLTPKRANQILRARGIAGLVILPPPYSMRQDGRLTLPVEWDKFSVVEIDDTITEPVLHRVRHNHLSGIWMALQELETLGYRRIGLCLRKEIEFATHHRWAAGYFYWDKIRGYGIEPLICEQYRPEEIKRWIRKNRLDAVLSPGVEVLGQLEALGIAVPGDLGYASLDLFGQGTKDVSGVDQERGIIGGMAIDLLVTMLHRGVRGEPARPTCWTAGASWRTGVTCARQKNIREISTIDNSLFESPGAVLRQGKSPKKKAG